jgi:glutathione synthase/RimK-type ligase-like ATP-grasp enzyme
MNLLILEQDRYPERRLFSALGSECGLNVSCIDPSEISIISGKPFLDSVDLPGIYDAVVVRSYRRFATVRSVAMAFQENGRLVLGLDPMQASFTQDKLCDIEQLIAAHVPVPETWFNANDTPHTTVVAKENWGYGGAGVALADMSDRVTRERPSLDWVNTHFQEFLPADEDWRVLVCEGRPLPYVIVRKPAPGDFRTNTHQGGQVEVISAGAFPQADALMTISTQAARALGRPCAGVDLRRGRDGTPVVLEVNRTPRLRLGDHTEEIIRYYLTTWAGALRSQQRQH